MHQVLKHNSITSVQESLSFYVHLSVSIILFSVKEFMGPEYILAYGFTGHIGWNLAHFLLPLTVWLAGNWFNFSISAACIALILFIILW